MLRIDSLKLAEVLNINIDTTFQIVGISTDTRTIQKGNLFVPLTGESFNGHNFVITALNTGAETSLCNLSEYENRDELKKYKDKLILVENAEKAYFKIMSYWRDQFKELKVIGIGGSVGKTTTKEMIRAICEQDGETIYTKENLNTAIAMCSVVNEIKEDTKYLVCEMGTDSFGEITEEAEIVKPDIGVCLSVTATHAEKLGGNIEGVAKAESEMVEYFKDRGTILLNIDDEYVSNMQNLVKESEIITFSKSSDQSDIKVENYEINDEGMSVSLNILKNIFVPTWGEGNLYNIMAAAGIAKKLNITDEIIRKGLKNYAPVHGRLTFYNLSNNAVLLDDAYNANPQSMKQSIEVFNKLYKGKKKIYILGDMRELGIHSNEAHKNLAEIIKQYCPDVLFYFGEYGGMIKELTGVKNIYLYPNTVTDFEAEIHTRVIKEYIDNDTWLLAKGSKGTGVWRIADKLKA